MTVKYIDPKKPITNFQGKYWFLSNQYLLPLPYKGYTYRNVIEVWFTYPEEKRDIKFLFDLFCIKFVEGSRHSHGMGQCLLSTYPRPFVGMGMTGSTLSAVRTLLVAQKSLTTAAKTTKMSVDEATIR